MKKNKITLMIAKKINIILLAITIVIISMVSATIKHNQIKNQQLQILPLINYKTPSANNNNEVQHIDKQIYNLIHNKKKQPTL
ncbi:hypothetical protein CAXC1_350002 [Candidatus Xenohaliotis californiensis]|uniref:Secreted protein n=1 Tax=Candidatus Xenohaliotis californiensis TaxID=84677 RepID=A0ABM9N8Q0_9RICK|nr:hypothetical protein CAXC1_350002 [Candidatus Xenohaliotis californiensis]